MKKLILFSLLILLISCSGDNGNGDQSGNIVDGNGTIILEYRQNIGTDHLRSHTFKDQGTKLDKVFDENGDIETEFFYNSNNQLISIADKIKNGNDSIIGMKNVFYEYDVDNIVKITIDKVEYGVSSTKITNYIYEDNFINIYSPNNLLLKRYELNNSGKITRIEEWDYNGDNYDYNDIKYYYDSKNRLDHVTGNYYYYIAETDTLFEHPYHYYGGYEYFDYIKNPFENVYNNIYLNYILIHDIHKYDNYSQGLFNKNLFGTGVSGIFSDDLQALNHAVRDNSVMTYLVIREENIEYQSNGFPKRGLIGPNARRFEIIYQE